MTAFIEVRPIRGGAAPAIAKLRQVMRRVRNPTMANRQVSVWLARWVNDNFKSEGGNVGKWKPFKAGGRLRNGRVDTTAKLLQDTGALRASFLPFHSRKVAGIGANAPYSIYHELGIPSRGLPSRRMLPLASDTKVTNAIIRIYDTFIRKALK